MCKLSNSFITVSDFSRRFSRHKEEARAAGVSDVVDLDLPDEDELDKELILLAQQQEKLLAELALAYEQESEREREEMESGRREAFDKEMEARVRAMNLSVAPEEIEGAFEEVREVRKHKQFGKNSSIVFSGMLTLLELYTDIEVPL